MPASSSITKAAPVDRILIPHRSWTATIFWWKVYFRKWYQQYWGPKKTPYIPPKGPQVWAFPPPADMLGRCVPSQWKDEESGWTMTVVSPPPKTDSSSDPTKSKRAVFYLHGSGFRIPISYFQWGYIAYLAELLDADMVVPPYPLGPTNTGPEIMPVLTKIYAEFLKRHSGQEIVLAGDSAGGTLALCLLSCALLASPPLPLPQTVILISPAVNMAMDNPDMWANAPNDIFLQPKACVTSLRMWAGITSPTDPIPESKLSDPCLNPMAGDFRSLVGSDIKFIFTSGTWDVLHPDVVRFVEKCEEQGLGGQTTYIEGEHMFHGFPVAYDTSPEARKATDLIVQVVDGNRNPQ